MKNTQSFLFVVVILAALVTPSCTDQAIPERSPENVVILLIDTLRQDHVSAYGYHRNTSPIIDGLAERGVLADGVSPTSWTKPGTASLLTGLHPIIHQAVDRDDILSDSVTTLAEILDGHGFMNLAVSGNAYVSNKFSMDQGFDEFVLVQRVPGPGPSEAEELNKRVITLLDKINGPFFLYVHYVDPHAPYDPPYGWNGEPLPENARRRAPMDNSQLLMAQKIKRPADLMQATLDLYDGEVRYVDTQIGLLLDELESRSLLDSTLVVVTADHGEEFEDHGTIGHGRTLFREVTRVPLVFSAPGYVKERAKIGTVQLESVAPTVLDLLGLKDGVSRQFDGPSVAQALRTGKMADPPPIMLHLDYESRAALGFVEDDTKLLVSNNPFEKALYDLRSDPLENENLLRDSDQQKTANRLGADLVKMHNNMMERAIDRATTVVDDETVEALQALGYLTDVGDGSAGTDNSNQKRNLPASIRSPDPHWGGFLGLEDLTGFTDCITLADDPPSPQLFAGWRLVGRKKYQWSEPTATVGFFVSRPANNRALALSGQSHGKRKFTIQVSANDQHIGTVAIGSSGPFDRSILLPAGLQGRILIELTTDPPFSRSPRENTLGVAEGALLGVQLAKICLADADNPS